MGHIPHFQKRGNGGGGRVGGAELWFSSFPFFGKYLENAVFLAWNAKSIIKAKEKRSCLKPNDIVSLFFVTFEGLTPTFRLLLKLVLHFPSYLWAIPTTFQSTYNDLQAPNLSLTEVATPHFNSCPLKKLVLHFTTYSYASAFIRLWGETFILASFPTHSVTEQLTIHSYERRETAYHILSNIMFID